ncbi:MAG: histidine phosphatase family protein, partial [Propionibacterium sp.]|nr:histidine phosphatase family protein [Propionibacterium sp.]
MSSERTQIILWRHGQTSFNVESRFQGHLDAPLNSVGLTQAEVAAAGLSRFPVDAIYASPLQRAYNTARALARRVDLPIVTDSRLMEISVGSWEGMFAEDIYRAHPEFALALAEGRDARRSETGETSA